MPRQAIYSLSSRAAKKEDKIAFIEAYQGETKSSLLEKLRQTFPLSLKDKRNSNKTKGVLDLLQKTLNLLSDDHFNPSKDEKREIKEQINKIQSRLLNI